MNKSSNLLMSVIVPFRNSAATLPDCLAALAAGQHPGAEYFFVNNASSDGSAEIVRRFIRETKSASAWRLLDEERLGSDVARNRAAREAAGEWLVFTDSDCMPEPDWLKDLEREMQSGASIAALAGQILPGKITNAVSKCLSLYTLPPNREERVWRAFTLTAGGFPTANFAVRRAVFERMGGFDESAAPAGDHDLCARIYAAGLAIKALARARVRHIHRTKFRNLAEQSFRFGTTHALMLKRYSPGVCLLDFPFVRPLRIETSRCRLWLECNQADKKMLGAIIAGFVWTPLFILAPAYLAYLALEIRRQGARMNIRVSVAEAPFLAGLLLLKSAAMTAGRVRGSLRHKVLCI